MSSIPPISHDAVVWSVAESERADALASAPLLVLLHGRGSHERDLFALAPLLPEGIVIASVRAPIGRDGGYAWFPVGEPGLPDLVGADAVTLDLLAWLDGLHAAGPVSVLGFSQGAAMTTQLMRHAPERFASFVNLSGFTVPGEISGDAALETLRPEVFWGRDPEDPMIPQFAIQRTMDWLPSHSTLELHEYAGIEHSISQAEIEDVNQFLRRTLLAN